MAMNQSITLILNSKLTHSPALIAPNVIPSFKQLSLPFEAVTKYLLTLRERVSFSECLLASFH